MRSYFDAYPEKSQTELRTITFFEDHQESKIPRGLYAFTEFFCVDLTCDCQRVLIKVYREDLDSGHIEEVATLSYAWPARRDASWDFILEHDNPDIDPFHRQADYAWQLLELWKDMLASDPDYGRRLVSHYEELRADFGEMPDHAGEPSQEAIPPAPHRPRQPKQAPVRLTAKEKKARRKKLMQRKRPR